MHLHALPPPDLLLSSPLSYPLSSPPDLTTSARGAHHLHLRIGHLIFGTNSMLRRLHVVFLLSPSMPGSSSSATLTLYIPWSGFAFAVLVSTQKYLWTLGREC